MKKFAPLLVLPALAALTGCLSTNQAAPSAGFNGTTAAIFQADVDVGGKISGSAVTTEILGFIVLGADKQADGVNYGVNGAPAQGPLAAILGGGDPAGLAKAKSAAAYNALTTGAADVLVAPTYVVDIEDFYVFKKYTAKVTAFKGTIKTVKQEKFDGKNVNSLNFGCK